MSRPRRAIPASEAVTKRQDPVPEQPQSGAAEEHEPLFDAPATPVLKTMWASPAGKKRLAPRLVAVLPTHKTYVEPFAGSAAVLFAKERSEVEVLNDANEEIANAYRAAQKLGAADLERLRKMDWTGSREVFEQLKKATPSEAADYLRRFLYLTCFSYGRKRYSGYSPDARGGGERAAERVAKWAPRLRGVKVYDGDYEPVVRKYDGKDTVHFLDPPYPGHNVSVGERQFDEERFLKVCKAIKGRFLVTYGVRGRFPKLAREAGWWTKVLRTPRAIQRMRGVGGSPYLAQLLVANFEPTWKSLDGNSEPELVDWTEEMGVLPMADIEPAILDTGELHRLHYELHEVHKAAEPGVADLAVNLHARVVDELYERGVSHPHPPDQGLDDFSETFEAHASAQPQWARPVCKVTGGAGGREVPKRAVSCSFARGGNPLGGAVVPEAQVAKAELPEAKRYVVLLTGSVGSLGALSWALDNIPRDRIEALHLGDGADWPGLSAHCGAVAKQAGVRLTKRMARADLLGDFATNTGRVYDREQDCPYATEVRAKSLRDALTGAADTVVLDGEHGAPGEAAMGSLAELGVPVFRPLIGLDTAAVWKLVQKAGFEPMPAAAEAGGELGCWSCPFASSVETALVQKQHSDLWGRWSSAEKDAIGHGRLLYTGGLLADAANAGQPLLPVAKAYSEELRHGEIRSPELRERFGATLTAKAAGGDPYQQAPEGVMPFVVQHHFRGQSVHTDLRIGVQRGKLAVGWTLSTQVAGSVKEPVTTLGAARKVGAGDDVSQIDWAAGGWQSPLRAEQKPPHPWPWLDVEGVSKQPEPGGPPPVGGTRNFPGVFHVLDKGEAEFGAQAPRLHEYFLRGGKLQGRLVFVAAGAGVEKAAPRRDLCMRCEKVAPQVDVLWAGGRARAWMCKACFPKWRVEVEARSPGAEIVDVREVRGGEEAPLRFPDHDEPVEAETHKAADLWLAVWAKDARPHVLGEDAVREGWMPPAGVSALPAAVRERVPAELRYWTLEGDAARAKRDELAVRIDELGVAFSAGATEKREGDGVEPFAAMVSIVKAADEDDGHYVTGVVLEPDEVDAQNDTIPAKVIRRAAERFLAKYNRETKLGVMHKQFENVGLELVQSWIAHEDTTIGGQKVKKGSWLMVVKVVDDALWKRVQQKEITGFSIGGTAKVI